MLGKHATVLHSQRVVVTHQNNVKEALQRLRTIQYLLFDAEVLLVRELVTGGPVPCDPDGFQHSVSDPTAIARFSHERRDCLNMGPPMLASYLWQVRGTVLVAARVGELDNDPVRANLSPVHEQGSSKIQQP